MLGRKSSIPRGGGRAAVLCKVVREACSEEVALQQGWNGVKEGSMW